MAAFNLDAAELLITIDPFESTHYQATAAVLLAEGLLPPDMPLPLGTSTAQWQRNGFEHWLRRTKPPGARGPAKTWRCGDYWFLTVRPASQEDWFVRRVNALQAEYRGKLRELTPEYLERQEQQLRRFVMALTDTRFLAFRRLIPALPEQQRRVRA